MVTQRKIIPAKPRQAIYGNGESKSVGKIRVAAYARVSTDFEEQANSYQNQKEYFQQLAEKNRDKWLFVKMYSDEGISGKNTRDRNEFMDMIEDCRNGLIDRIITKSISRFARNTKDCLEYIRELRSLGISVYFEKENLDTNDPNSDFVLTIMASLAEEESRSISRNLKWTYSKLMEKGRVFIDINQFIGYDMDEKHNLIVNHEQAKIIKRIYKEFGSGKTAAQIAKGLTEDKILTPGGKEKWQSSTVLSILRNEKYKGDLILQKTYQKDFLDKRVKNVGQAPMYIFTNHHEAIIDREYWDWIQMEIKRRVQKHHGEFKGTYSNATPYIMSGMIVCGECGRYYRRHRQGHNDGTYTEAWNCTGHIMGKNVCSSLPIHEVDIQNLFMRMVNRFLNPNDELNEKLEQVKKELLAEDIKGQIENLKKQSEKLQKELIQNMEHGVNGKLDDNEVEGKNNKIIVKQDEIESKIEELKWADYQKDLKIKAVKIIESFKKNGKEMVKYDEQLLDKLVDIMVVEEGGVFIEVRLMCGISSRELLLKAPKEEKIKKREKEGKKKQKKQAKKVA